MIRSSFRGINMPVKPEFPGYSTIPLPGEKLLHKQWDEAKIKFPDFSLTYITDKWNYELVRLMQNSPTFLTLTNNLYWLFHIFALVLLKPSKNLIKATFFRSVVAFYSNRCAILCRQYSCTFPMANSQLIINLDKRVGLKKILWCCVMNVRGSRDGAVVEYLPPTNVARVRFPDSASNVGWVCCWFSSLLREVFLQVLRFSPLPKNQHF